MPQEVVQARGFIGGSLWIYVRLLVFANNHSEQKSSQKTSCHFLSLYIYSKCSQDCNLFGYLTNTAIFRQLRLPITLNSEYTEMCEPDMHSRRYLMHSTPALQLVSSYRLPVWQSQQGKAERIMLTFKPPRNRFIELKTSHKRFF